MIIHVAWKVDFNQSLGSFEPNIRGTRNLIDFALSGPNPASTRFLFTSSVTSAQSWNQDKGPFPEEVVTDASVAIGGGYGEGKYVSEQVRLSRTYGSSNVAECCPGLKILAKSGLQVTSIRIGQISGGMPNGAWATSEWLPILVKSSVALGVLPSASGVSVLTQRSGAELADKLTLRLSRGFLWMPFREQFLILPSRRTNLQSL